MSSRSCKQPFNLSLPIPIVYILKIPITFLMSSLALGIFTSFTCEPIKLHSSIVSVSCSRILSPIPIPLLLMRFSSPIHLEVIPHIPRQTQAQAHHIRCHWIIFRGCHRHRQDTHKVPIATRQTSESIQLAISFLLHPSSAML